MKVLTKIIIGSFLFLEPTNAMNEEEKTSTLPKIQSIQSYSPKIQSSSLSTSFESLPNVLVGSIFKFLDIKDLGRIPQVSTRWKKIEESSNLWRYMGLRYYGDFLSKEDLKENPKQKIISHYLSVIVNTIEDLKQIENIVNRHQLGAYFPLFKEYVRDIYVGNLLLHEELIAQGNKEAINRKIEGLLEGKYGYVKDLTAAREFNELLVEKGNPEAIRRKLESLTLGGVRVWFSLASRGYHLPNYVSDIIPLYGDVKNLIAAREFNNLLIEKGDLEAIERKIEGLTEGGYGYEKNPTAAREFNEFLVEKGNPKAIKRKIEGILNGKYGYEKAPSTMREFNNLLIEKEDLEAIERKIEDLTEGGYGYEKDLVTARKFSALLGEKGSLKAIKKKLIELMSRYKADPKAAEFIEGLVICEFPIARAIGKYVKAFALKYGVSQLGYEKNREKAFKFIMQYHVPY